MESHRVYKLLLRTYTVPTVDSQQKLTQWEFCRIFSSSHNAFQNFFNLIYLLHLIMASASMHFMCFFFDSFSYLFVYFVLFQCVFVWYNLTLFYYYYLNMYFFKEREKMWIWIGNSGSLTDLWDFIRFWNLLS